MLTFTNLGKFGLLLSPRCSVACLLLESIRQTRWRAPPLFASAKRDTRRERSATLRLCLRETALLINDVSRKPKGRGGVAKADRRAL